MTRVNRSQSLLKWEILSERANSQPWEKTSRNTGKKGRNCYFNNIYRWGGNSTPLMNSYLPKFKFFRYFFTNSAKTFFLTTAWAQKIQVSWGHQKVHAALNNFFLLLTAFRELGFLTHILSFINCGGGGGITQLRYILWATIKNNYDNFGSK